MRHHFRDSLAGRISFLPSDIVITDDANHFDWEALSETESLVVINGFERLIAMKGSGDSMKCGINKITVEDIFNVFKGNEWVAARWVSQLSFSENLKEFNNRRNDIRLMGLEAFIQEYNPIAYERFSSILKKGRTKFDAFLLELHVDLDANDLVSKDIFTFLNTYLRNEGLLSYLGSIV